MQPHLTVGLMGNIAWLCTRESWGVDLVGQVAVSTREGVLSHPGRSVTVPASQPASMYGVPVACQPLCHVLGYRKE